MTDLRTALVSASSQLQEALKDVKKANGQSTSFPDECYGLWMQRVKLKSEFEATLELLTIRTDTWQLVNKVCVEGDETTKSPDSPPFWHQDLTFAVARHIALTAYVTTTWSVYDRLANICGRLIGPVHVAKNLSPTANPKLIEHFIRIGKKGEGSKDDRPHGFSLAGILHPAYGWPASVSYAIRNWLVHEGIEAEGIKLFSGTSVDKAFELSADAMKRIEAQCKERDAVESGDCCFSDRNNHPWYDRDLLAILGNCHDEVDTMFANLTTWSVDSFVGQIRTFSLRDAPTQS